MKVEVKKTVKTLHGNKYLQSTLVECAWGATRKKEGFLKRKYQSLAGRRGKKKALVAVGHKIIVATYHILNEKKAYQEPQLHQKSKRKRKKSIRNYINKLEELGLTNEEIQQIMENKKSKQKGRIFTGELQEASRV